MGQSFPLFCQPDQRFPLFMTFGKNGYNLTIFDHFLFSLTILKFFDNFYNSVNFLISFASFYNSIFDNFDNANDNPRDLWPSLRH